MKLNYFEGWRRKFVNKDHLSINISAYPRHTFTVESLCSLDLTQIKYFFLGKRAKCYKLFYLLKIETNSRNIFFRDLLSFSSRKLFYRTVHQFTSMSKGFFTSCHPLRKFPIGFEAVKVQDENVIYDSDFSKKCHSMSR